MVFSKNHRPFVRIVHLVCVEIQVRQPEEFPLLQFQAKRYPTGKHPDVQRFKPSPIACSDSYSDRSVRWADSRGFRTVSCSPRNDRGTTAAIRARKIDVIVVYKVDRLTRSLADFAKLVELSMPMASPSSPSLSSSIPPPPWAG